MRVGIFGGTFNPPHIGHLIVAEFIREEANLDKIIFIPC
ncbi:nicotinate-nicotinamide nucleotide adenylyltransferase, partial [Candidatus Kryptonium thompsonii]